MSYVIVDVESDGPIPAEYSMVCFGAVIFDDRLDQTFYGQTRPISDRFVPEALAVSGFSREQHTGFDDPKSVMEKFANWLAQHAKGRPVFVSDNVAFDWQFINYYFHRFVGRNPFGFSGRRILDVHAVNTVRGGKRFIYELPFCDTMAQSCESNRVTGDFKRPCS